MTAVVYSAGLATDDAGTASGIYCGAGSVISGQGVYVWISHNGTAPGLYKFEARDSGGATLFTPSVLASGTTPGGDKIVVGYAKAPSSIADCRLYVSLRDAGDTADVSVTGFDRGYVLLTGQHGSVPHGTVVSATGTGAAVTGAYTTPGVDALALTFIVRDGEWKTVSGEVGTERVEGFKTTVVTQTVATTGSVREIGTLSESDGWLALTIPVLPAATASATAPSFSNVSAALKSGKPNDVRVSFTSNISTVGLTVTASATTPNQPTAVTSTSVTWSGSDGYIDLDDLGPGEPWSFTVTGDNGQVATVGAGDITIRALSFTGSSYAASSYSETALRWLDRNTGEVYTGGTVAAGASLANPPYLAVTLLSGDIMAKDAVTPTASPGGVVSVGATGTDGVSAVSGVAAGTATISATSGTRTASYTVTVTGEAAVVVPTWVTTSIPPFVVGSAGSYRLQASNATLFSATGLPSGATLAGDGLIEWEPGADTTATVVFKATSSSGGEALRTLTLSTVSGAVPVFTTTSPLPSGTVGVSYSTSISASSTSAEPITTEGADPLTTESGTTIVTEAPAGGAVTYSAKGVPAGLTLSGAGLLSGQALFPGTSEIVVTATNAAGSTTETFVLTIDAAATLAEIGSAWAPLLRGRT